MNPFAIFKEKPSCRAHYQDSPGLFRIENQLQHYIRSAHNRPIIFLCIGTDRSTGDALGPLIGTKLFSAQNPGIRVFGTLEEPVHAENLAIKYKQIQRLYANPYIIAVDACLGRIESIGTIALHEGPLKPGTAVQKELLPVGEIHLTGVVNVNGHMQYTILQNTRLYMTWLLADAISALILQACLGLPVFSTPILDFFPGQSTLNG